MKQLIQNFKTGELKIEEVPAPSLKEGCVLVQNAFSLISVGTEKSTVDMGKSSLFEKAQKRPDLVKQVLQNIKKEGIWATFQKVQNKLDTPKALGYSCTGIVLDSRDSTGRFKKGDRVACAGQDFASHAEAVVVPENLVVQVPGSVSFEEAAFTTIGAIALQGVRQSDAKIGEKACVIGLGLIGQITAQLLKAQGCEVCGIDLSESNIALAQQWGIDAAINRNESECIAFADQFTQGHGFDKVIIAASSATNDPIVLATEIIRKKGVIVVVGSVKMDVPREPYFYRKELELKIATSYGPGRYDPLYEEAGIDYPYAYVRFTENRNMETFLQLVSKKQVKVQPLISRTFDFNDAVAAYDLIMGKKEPVVGILLRYHYGGKEAVVKTVNVKTHALKKINVGFIGAGSFAQSYLLPHIRKENVSLDTVVTTKGTSAKHAARKFGFQTASTEPEAVLDNKNINVVFIATRHDSHARLVCESLKRGKHVFVEKPLAMNEGELKEVLAVYRSLPESPMLMVGFNRRFAPLSEAMKKEFMRVKEPLAVTMRVNAGTIPDDHWIQNETQGGGRIIGEACHFVDLMLYLHGALPVHAHVVALPDATQDSFSVTLTFENKGFGVITYLAQGAASLSKEYIEACGGRKVFINHNFRFGELYGSLRCQKMRLPGKGHKQEVEWFIHALQQESPMPIPMEQLVATSLATFRIKEAIQKGVPAFDLGPSI